MVHGWRKKAKLGYFVDVCPCINVLCIVFQNIANRKIKTQFPQKWLKSLQWPHWGAKIAIFWQSIVFHFWRRWLEKNRQKLWFFDDLSVSCDDVVRSHYSVLLHIKLNNKFMLEYDQILVIDGNCRILNIEVHSSYYIFYSYFHWQKYLWKTHI